MGHPCGINFDAAKFLAEHREFFWQAPVLQDLIAGPWTVFRTGEHAAPQTPPSNHSASESSHDRARE